MSLADSGERAPAARRDTVPPRDLVETTIRFCRALRERGLAVSPEESIDAVRALSAVDLGDRREIYFALRALLTSRREDLPHFDRAFEAWFDAEFAEANRADWAVADGVIPRPAVPPPPARSRESIFALDRWAPLDTESDDEAASIAAPSTNDPLTQRDFSTFSPEELDAIQRIAMRMVRRLSSRPSRRWKPARRGARVHLRGALRESAKLAGDVVELRYRTRRLRRTSLVVLCDVSGSMDLYSRFLLQFIYALQRSFARVETFTFSTRLARITEHLRGRSYRDALDRLSRDVAGWSGGTRIGESVTSFVEGWPRLMTRRTVVVILSDGWDTGDPTLLEAAMRRLHRETGRVIWLNPLLGNAEYQPLTRGMQAALPHVDVFAPIHNLESLEKLVAHLVL